MPNLRVISDNVIDRATLSGSSAANFSTTSLQTQRKSDVWRAAAGSTAWIKAVWPAAESLQGVVLPLCDLSPTAAMRVRITDEASTTNYAAGSESLSAAAGWGGCSVSTASSSFAGVVPFVSVAKIATNSSENRSLFVGSVLANTTYTLSIGLRAGSSPNVEVGLYDTSSSAWGADAASSASLSGPGTLSQTEGGLFSVTGLSTSVDTLLVITRTFAVNSAMNIFIYPGTHGSTTVGDSILATRLQLEVGPVATSYYPALSAAAMRPLGYMDAWQEYINYGYRSVCPAPAISLRGFTAAQAAGAYAFGGGATATYWLPAVQQAYGMTIDISDPDNAAGYIEAAFLVAGPYWEPLINFDYGASAQIIDTTKNARSDAGDLLSDAGTVSRKVSLPLSKLAPADRAALWSILLASSTRYPIFLSMFPESSDLALERDHQVYGKLVQLPAMALPFFNIASATVEVESA